jgi:hypothetical protein
VSNLYEILKNLMFLTWCGYITVMCVIGAFQAEEPLDVMIAVVVWMFVLGVSSRIYEG